jgi:adenylate cyclase
MTGPIHKVTNLTPAPETRGSGWRCWAIVALLSLLVALVVAASDGLGLLAKLDLQGYDLLVKIQDPDTTGGDIVFVDFDEETVHKLNAFPLPRLLVAEVIDRINSCEPAVIGLDVILDQPRVKAEDDQLAAALAKAGNVIIAGEYGRYGDHPTNNPLPIFENVSPPIFAVGFVDMPTDSDGIHRRMFLKALTSDYKRFSFPVALATYYSGKQLRPGRPGFLRFGDMDLPLATTAPDTAWIHFHPSSPVSPKDVISVLELLAPDFDGARLKGKIVLIGQTSEKGKDLYATPVPEKELNKTLGRTQLTGTEIHAAAIDTLLSGKVLRTMHASPRWALGLVLGFLVAACGFRHRWFISVGACALFVAGVFFLAAFLFTSHHIWMPFVSTEACLLLALPVGLGYRSVEERRLKRMIEAERCQLMGFFERYVSADVAAEIWSKRDQIVLAGEERVATILFSDIRSFTAMTCGVPSKDVLAWLNRYLTAMGEVIKDNKGFLNKFIGDGIMVVFGAPLSAGPREDACRAVRCAQEMLVRLEKWNAALPPGEQPLKIGIGIHTGSVTAGNVGSPDRLEYSVIGEAVNLASRLEALTKDFKTPIVLSPETYEFIRTEFSAVSIGEAQVRGFTHAIPLYTVESQSAVEVHS